MGFMGLIGQTHGPPEMPVPIFRAESSNETSNGRSVMGVIRRYGL